MWNIKALALTIQKLLARLKFQRGGQNDRITEWQNDRMTEWQNDRQDKNNMPPDLRSRGHKKEINSTNDILGWIWQILHSAYPKNSNLKKDYSINVCSTDVQIME